MTKLYCEDFMKKLNLKKDNMNESDLLRVYNYLIYLRDSKIYSDRGFVIIDNGEQHGNQWICLIVKEIK